MITDEQKEPLLKQYNERGILKKEIRSYEVSLWTLQDEFITVLKWSDVEQKGRIENPKMTLNIDGTQKLSFTIPMYYREKGKLIENPNWYNTQNGNLMTGLRKLKVIFNKWDENIENNIFEFVITSITEGHENDILTCNIEAEGLAFQELGKIGYKISLSQANFELDYKDWIEKGKWTKLDGMEVASEPMQTVDYWCEQCGLVKYPGDRVALNPRQWYYQVKMNWKSFEFDGTNNRAENKVYEETYTETWDENLKPITIKSYQEKARCIDAEHSNLYNITQTIAEKFEIFCRYEYRYDENCHIIGRVIVFYNNFLNENPEDLISLQYSYDSSKIERTMESAEVTTKLFVMDTDASNTAAGYFSIMDAPANASKEDYILNFDYMYKTGAINQQQYDAIPEFEKKMREYNTQLNTLQLQRDSYEVQKPEVEAKKQIAERSIALDEEQIQQNTKLRNALSEQYGDNQGYIQLTAANPDYLILIDGEDGNKYVNLKNTNKGIVEDTVKVYLNQSRSKEGSFLTRPATKFEFEHDDMNNVTKLILKDPKEYTENTVDFDWMKMCKECFIPSGYNGNVNLTNRKIIDAQGTLHTNYITPYRTNEQNETVSIYSDQYFYDIIYTPITADGAVLTTNDLNTYFAEVIYPYDNITDQFAADKRSKGLFLHYVKLNTTYPSEHSSAYNWLTNLESRQAEWNKVRAAYNWFEYDSNPNNIPITEPLGIYGDINNYKITPKTTATHAYLIYKYEPHLYYDNIIKIWQTKFAQDTEDKNRYDSELTEINNKLEQINSSIKTLTTKKRAEIVKFEHMMGPAIREGYWQPENYNDYGEHKYVSGSITNDDITIDVGDGAIIAWDTKTFDEEDTLYYEIGVNKNKEYYPCIDLNAVFNNNIPTDLSDYSVVWKATDYNNIENAVRDLMIFHVGSQALIKYITVDQIIKPVLMLIGAKTLTAAQIARMKDSSTGAARLQKYEVRLDAYGHLVSSADQQQPIAISNGQWIQPNDSNDIVYPRIKFSSLQLKTDTTSLVLKYKGHLLEVAKDYYVRTRNTERGNNRYPEYYITIKPETLIKYKIATSGSAPEVYVDYILSNANTAIYLDALKVSKENAYPKVSYSIATNMLNEDLTKILYSKMAQIVMINDTDLKFENTFGYISGMELDLDFCENDTLEIKNYKTKFEDLFSTIVAQTEAMKQSAPSLAAAAAGMTPLTSAGMEETLNENYDLINSYFEQYLGDSQFVRDRLTELFTEAGKILADSNKALSNVASLNIKNAEILRGFVQNVQDELTVKVTRSPTQPSSFKPGDVWIEIDANKNEIGRYVAMSNSEDGGQMTRTYDGTLAAITGAALNIDADKGKIDIEGQNEINIKSGNDIYIAANENVSIVGNKSVNIGGTTINIGSSSAVNTDGEYLGGINLVASGYKSVEEKLEEKENETPQEQEDRYLLSKVCINPKKIDMASSSIEMRASSELNFVTSYGDTTSTSAIHISSKDGVWIGTGNANGVHIFSGNIATEDDGTLQRDENDNPIVSVTGASVELNSEHLIFGFANTHSNNATAVELTEHHVIIAAGGNLDYTPWEKSHAYAVGNVVLYNNDHYKCKEAHTSGDSWDDTKWVLISVTGGASGLVGARFTKESIGFATQVGSGTAGDPYVYGAFIMNNKGLTLGSTDGTKDLANTDSSELRSHFATASHGSYVRVAPEGIELGSLANLYVNTNNFKLQTDSNNSGTANTSIGNIIFAIGSNLQKINSNNLASATLAQIKAADEDVDNDVDVRLALNNNGLYIKGTVYATDGSFTGTVYATNGSFTGNISATNGNIGGWRIGTQKLYAPLIQTDENTGVETILHSNYVGAAPGLDETAGAVFWAGGLTLTPYTGADNKTHYIPSAPFIVGNNGYLESTHGKIGGWNLRTNDTTTISGATLNRMWSGNDSTYVALDSGSTYNSSPANEDYAIWCGAQSSGSAPFRVGRNGKVYLHSLMVLDVKTNSTWGLGGSDSDHEDIYTDSNDGQTYGYKAINFSKLNFKQAVSVTGSWSSNNVFTARVSLWGILNKHQDLTASFDIGTPTLGPRETGDMYHLSVPVTCKINNTTGSETVSNNGVYIDCRAAINYGYSTAAGLVSRTGSNYSTSQSSWSIVVPSYDESTGTRGTRTITVTFNGGSGGGNDITND